MFPKWSHDGRKIAYQSMVDGSLWIVNPDGTERKRLLTNLKSPNFMFSKWSPDSTKITAIVENGVVVVSADGSGEYWTIPNNGFGSWSPDGKRIVYVSGSGDVHVINADGTHDKKLVSKMGILETPLGASWSPDGTKVTYPVGEVAHGPWQSNVSVWVMTVSEIGAIPTLMPTPLGTPTFTPTVMPTQEESPSSEEKGIPGFEAVFTIAGLSAVAYLLRKRK
ncbi:MAG: PGF-CTERM sorting domain-containing protein [Halobacteriota archaeon]